MNPAKTIPANLRVAGNAVLKPYALYCEKANGRKYVFQRYATREQAEAAAKMLREVGCRSQVEVSE